MEIANLQAPAITGQRFEALPPAVALVAQNVMNDSAAAQSSHRDPIIDHAGRDVCSVPWSRRRETGGLDRHVTDLPDDPLPLVADEPVAQTGSIA